MAGLFDSKFANAPTTSTSTTNQTPQWYQDLSYQQMMAAKAVASAPYEAYALPRLAEATPDQENAYTATRQNIGAWQPQYDIATKGAQSLAGTNPGTTQGVGYMQQAAGYNPMLAQQPYINAAMGRLSEGTQDTAANFAKDQQKYLRPDLISTGFDQGQNYINQSAGATQQAITERALAAAQPYLQSAAGSAAGGVDAYMGNYNSAVTDQIAKLGARNLKENLLPSISDQFIAAGQFGGSRMGEFGQRALRDTQESVLAQQAQTLQQGYGQALGASQTDLARQAQLAGTVGSISGADLSRTLQGAGQYGSLGQMQTGIGAGQQQTGLSALEQVQAAEQADRARKMQAAQQMAAMGGQQASAAGQYSTQLQNIGSGIAGATNSDASRQLSALQTLAELGQSKQSMLAGDAAALETIGLTQQQQEQRQQDRAHQDWLEQQQYPQKQLDWYQAQLRNTGQYLPNTTTSSGTTPIPTASPLSQLAGMWGAYKGMTTA